MLVFAAIPFDDLTLEELYGLLRLRSEVFVVEQNCPYQDLDNKDQKCIHILGKNNTGEILAHARIVPPGISYPEYSSIGRVVTSKKVRRTGEGVKLMEYSIGIAQQNWPHHDIKISAQSYLKKFYESLNFRFTGEAYMEDGIPHIGMVLSR